MGISEEITGMTMEDSTTIRIRISEIMVRQITTSSALAAEGSRMDMRVIQGQGTAQLGGRFAITAGSEIILVKYASDVRNPTINHKEHIKKLMQKEAGNITIVDFTIEHLDKPENIGQYGTIKSNKYLSGH